MVLDSYLDLSSFWRQEDLPGLPGAGAGLRGLPGLPAMMRCELCGKHCSNGANLQHHMNAMQKKTHQRGAAIRFPSIFGPAIAGPGGTLILWQRRQLVFIH